MASARRPSPISYDQAPSDDETEQSLSERGSLDSVRRDHEVLEDEDDVQRNLLLVSKSRDQLAHSQDRRRGPFARQRDARSTNKDDDQSEGLLAKNSKRSKAVARGEHGRKEPLYEMEEGGPPSPLSSAAYSDEATEIDREKMGAALAHQKSSKRRRICGITVLHAIIAALLVAIAYGAYLATMGAKLLPGQAAMASNGTSLFGPTTLLISLDGFRSDFVQRNLTPALNSLIKDGVSPDYMTPSFPSLTFPNHYTIVTGLYPESHGIVANNFYDEAFAEGFKYQAPDHSMQPKWWAPNPIWETAEHQGIRTAIHMWPGSEAHIGDIEPTHIDKYNGTEMLSRKADRILELLDKPGLHDDGASTTDPRPQFIAAYVPDVDLAGHKYGPNSTEITESIEQVDHMIKSVVDGLSDRNLTSIVNVVVVSDHGMAATSNQRLIQLEELIDPDLFTSMDGWPHYGLRPKKMEDLKAIHTQLQQQARRREGFSVYLRDEDMPQELHFTNNERIAPLWLMPHTGWAIVTKDEYDVEQGQKNDETYHPLGIHGYRHDDPLMRAIFIARGPAFPHPAGSRLDPFQNIEIYNILCDSLSIEPAANNGTLRLPLEPVGVHEDDEGLKDHMSTSISTNGTATLKSPSNSTVALHKPSIGVDEPGMDVGSRPVVDDASRRKANAKQRLKHFVEKLKEKWRGFVIWIKGKKVNGHGSDTHGQGKESATMADGQHTDDQSSGGGEEEGAVKLGGHTNWAIAHTSSGKHATDPVSGQGEGHAKDDTNHWADHKGKQSDEEDSEDEHDGDKSEDDKDKDNQWHYTGPVAAQNKDFQPSKQGGGNASHTSFAGADDEERKAEKGPVNAQNPDYRPGKEHGID